jgi:KDO2-lipid IV(A) lauroyltransferase
MIYAAVARAWVAVIRASARGPAALRRGLAGGIGTLGWLLVGRRRRIADRNLRACFPQMPARERRRITRRMFRRVARGVLDFGVLWDGSAERLRDFVRVDGIEHFHAHADAPLILLAPHFVGLDAGGLRLSSERRMATLFAPQSNPVWDERLRAGRARFHDPVLIAKHGFDLRTALRALRGALPFYYLPDVDNGAANSIFVPFFGVPAATLPMVSRLARSTGARVMMAVTEQTPEGYVVHLEPPWEDFPGVSVEADTARMNREIERWVLRMPEQYLWTHRRFKTRPAGQADIYR